MSPSFAFPMMARFWRMGAVLIATLGLVVLAHAQANYVEFTVSYTSASGASSASLRVEDFADESSVEITGTGTQQSEAKLVYMPLDQTQFLSFMPTNVSEFRVSVKAPPNFATMIEGVERSSYTAAGGAQMLKFTLVRQGPRGPGNSQPIGQPSSITWGTPVPPAATVSPQGPYLTFNLGSGAGGDALPPLRIPLRYYNHDSEAIVPPDHLEISHATLATNEFQLDTPQATVRLTRNATDNGSYDLTFCALGTTTPFVSYHFEQTQFGGAPNGFPTRTIKVTKTVTGGNVYETLIKGQFIDERMGDTWTVEDWHKVDPLTPQPPTRVLVATQTLVQHQGNNPVPGSGEYGPPDTYIYLVQVKDSEASSTIVSQTKQEYRSYHIDYDFDWSADILVPYKVTEGVGDGDYVTEHFRHPMVSGVDGSASSTGFTRLEDTSNGNKRVYETWLDVSPIFLAGPTYYGVDANGAVVTTIDYDYSWQWSSFEWPTSIVRKVGNTFLSKSTFTYSATGAAGSEIATETRLDYPNVTDTPLQTITKRYQPNVTDPVLRDRPCAIMTPAGTQQSYAYEHGTYQGNGAFTAGGGNDLRITVLSGATTGGTLISGFTTESGTVAVEPIRLYANKSTRTTDFLQRGRLVRRETAVFTGGSGTSPVFTTIAWENTDYTVDGRVSSRSASNGTSYSATWVGTRLTEASDETQLLTTYEYDDSDRVTSTTRAAVGSLPALRTEFEYDAANQVRFKRVGPVTGERLVTETQYDRGGRVKKTKEPIPGTTSAAGTLTTETAYLNGGRDVQTTFAAGTSLASSKTTTRYVDGRTKSVTGSAAVEEHYTYDFDGLSRPRVTRTLTSQLKRPQATTYDLLGRVVEDRKNGFGTSGDTKPLVTYHEYNARGLPSKVFTVEASQGSSIQVSGDQLFEYDAFGQVSATGIDRNANGTLDPASTDRFQAVDTQYAEEGGAWWLRTNRKLYHTDNSTSFCEAKSYTRLLPPAGTLSQTIDCDYYNNTTSQTVVVDTSNKSRRQLSVAAGGTTVEQTIVGGLVTKERRFDDADPALAGTPTLSTSYTYDAQGRQTGATDARVGTSSVQYHYGTSFSWKQLDARSVLVATRTYDAAGRLASLVTPASTTGYLYDSLGRITDETDNGTYPVRRTYTDFGELHELKTYRNGLGGTADVTTFAYDDNTGVLSSKTDAAGQAVTYNYVYSLGYQDVTRTSARAVTATSRFALDTGALSQITYSDGTTAVSYTYTRTGQVATVTDATGTRDFLYDHEQLSSEALSTWYRSLVLTTRRQDSTSVTNNTVSGRYSGFMLGYSTNGGADLDKETAVSYGYDNFGRINAVTADYKVQGSRAALSVPASYSYQANSSLWRQLTQGSYIATRDFEPNRNIVTAVTATHSTGGTIATFGYQTDDTGRRNWATQAGMAFGDVSPATYYRYSYSSDRPSELASATGYRGTDPSSTANPLPGRGFSFTYDTAGNRKGAGVDTDAVSYTDGSGNAGGNNLNQTKQRGTLKTRVSGAAHASTTVTVGGATASRSDRYWDYALPTYAQYTSVGITAALSGQSQSGSVQALTRPATESLSYDADGNLTSDSLWTYEYDAENRLKRMYTNASAITWGAPDRELVFTYDYFGRRARKIAKLNGTPTYDRKFVYEGWRLLAEIESSTGNVVRTYTWGLDLASSLSSTGGVGGLILETVHTDTTLTAYHVTSDASGNVTALVNPVSGAVAAAYEYGPFGETVRAQTSDTTLAYQPIRFSSKFTDSETGLVYYGRRYYDPSLGRFINRDPIAESGGINLYAFVGNAPMNGIDVHGMKRWGWVDKISNFFNDLFDFDRQNKIERAGEEIVKLDAFEVKGDRFEGSPRSAGFGTFSDPINGQWVLAPSNQWWPDEVGGRYPPYAVNIMTGKIKKLPIRPAPGAIPLLTGIEGTPAEPVVILMGGVSLARGVARLGRKAADSAIASIDGIRISPFESSFSPVSGSQLQLAANIQAGAAFSDLVAENAATRSAAVLREVSITPFLDSGELAGFRFRADTIAVGDLSAPAESIEIIEAKASATAPYTPNQTKGFPLFERNGGMIRGDNGGTLLPPGMVLSPSPIRTVRPSSD